MKKLFAEFKKFISRGSVIDLAVGVIIGGAFTSIVTSLVNDIIMPLISLIIKVDITSANVVLQPAILGEDGVSIVKAAIVLNYGKFIQYIINFLLIAICVFAIVKIINNISNGSARLQARQLKKLKAKHPEYFDEDTDAGTAIYEKLKKEHPECFKEEIEKEKAAAEAAKKAAVKEPTFEEKQLALLSSINEKLNNLNK